MRTHCIQLPTLVARLGRREIHAGFDGGHLSSDGGALLLRAADRRIDLTRRIAACFRDHRRQDLVEHPVQQLVAQRIVGLACGYEDLNDHSAVRRDPLLACVVGKTDPMGDDRGRGNKGRALASPATLSRLEHAPANLVEGRRDLKLTCDTDAMADLFVALFLDAHDEAPDQIILDVDATDDRIHGKQEGAFFHGYYGHYCYLPLYIFCGDHLLAAKLRTANQDGAAGCLEELQRIIAHIREQWPDTHIIVRGDSGFCRDALLTWCEAQTRVDYVLGFARNDRIVRMVQAEQLAMRTLADETEQPQRCYADRSYRTQTSWSATRRVVAKVEALLGKDNPRFVVTSLSADDVDAKTLYADVYCARGDMENRIKEQQLGMFADRTSCSKFRPNQMRLWWSSFAYVLMSALRRIGLSGTVLAKAQMSTMRTRLLKVGALITKSVRRIRIRLASAFPMQEVFWHALAELSTEGAVV